MGWVKQFNELSKHDAATAGGKGASLGEMTQAGIPVPPGYVILSSAFERFIEASDINIEIDAILKTVNVDAMHTVENASAQIQKLILEEKEIPKEIELGILTSFRALGAEFVAVRSSATAEDSAEAAWAGQLDSFLNTTESTLLTNVRHCWASLFTPRAIFYRFEKQLDQSHISVAVVVQKMVNSDAAGIAFSVHPVTEDRNQMIIEAGFGLGEAVVSGQITPDSYVVTKESRKILDKNVIEQKRGLFRKEGGGNEWRDISDGDVQVLSDEEIFALSETVIRIENHYGFPCDIEWAKEGNEMYIVQSRPITTLSPEKTIDNKAQPVVLSKIFSREKPLLYFSMWNDSDRKGYSDFLNYEVKNNLFLIPGLGRKGSVWYPNHEFDEITSRLKDQVNTNPDFVSSVTNRLDTEWEVIRPYLEDEKNITSFQDFEFYYTHLVSWWSAMTAAFELPNLEGVDEGAQETIFSYREISEKYTEKMSKLLKLFWESTFPDLKHLAFFITPTEVLKFRNGKNESLVQELEKRTGGCFMLNGEVHSLKDLDNILSNTGLELEEFKADDENEITGTVAYKGAARGTVRIIKGFKDMDSFKAGEVLVTEMTNPDYVPVMKIAAAVVTDEGGTTCHAAIASRELKVPCIVGTKFATQVLNDGDEVEVDADNGIVRVLKKSQTLVEKFLKELGEDELFKVEGDFFPLLVMVDWYNYYRPDGSIGTVYPALCFKRGPTIALYWSLTKYRNVSKEAFRQYLSGNVKLDEFNTQYLDLKARINDAYYRYYDKREVTEAALLTALHNAHALLREIDLQMLFLDALDQHAIREVLNEQDLTVRLDEIWKVSHIPDSYSFHVKNKEEILAYAETKPESLQFIYSGYVEVLSPEETRTKVAALDKNVLREDIAASKAEAERNVQLRSEEIKNLTNEEQTILAFIDWAGYLRDDRKTLITKCDVLIFNVVSDLYRLWGIDQTLVKVSLVSDVLKGRSHTETLLPAIEARLHKTALLMTGPDTYSEDLSATPDDVEALYQRQHTSSNESISGESASPGVVQGVVRVVLSVKDFDKFQDGEVLVTGMTRPEFVPLMKKAVGIVTDEGGITSHAAIVSRELRKPCVIGTRVATTKLKDGDLVEVDANEGVVRILASQKLDLQQDDYIPAFEAAGIPLLFSDMLMQTYGTIGVLQAYADGLLKEYVRKDYNDKNLSEGVALYCSSERFKKHLETLERVFTEAENKLGPLAIQGMREGVLAFFDLSKQVFDAYSKSDPFFTDRAFSETQHNETINKNLKQLQKIKDPYRVKINTFYLETNNYFETLLGTLEKQLAIPKDDLRWYLISDLLAAFDGHKLESDALQKRKRAYLQLGVAIGGGVAKNYFGKSAEDAARKLRRAYTGGDIRGVSANKGKEGTVRGVVKVINVDYGNLEVTRAAMNSMQHGQILVAQTTAPELMEACKKAKAIVTDNGGMLSHAAIVSRELNIPCVVGTEFATQVLKDGDLVEVDANEGVVRIIEKA